MENCLQIVSGQTLFLSLHDLVISIRLKMWTWHSYKQSSLNDLYCECVMSWVIELCTWSLDIKSVEGQFPIEIIFTLCCCCFFCGIGFSYVRDLCHLTGDLTWLLSHDILTTYLDVLESPLHGLIPGNCFSTPSGHIKRLIMHFPGK